METLRENYPRDVFYNLMNIIGTHDTARALTVLGVMSEDWKKSRDERAHYELPPDRLETAKRRLRLAAVIQFTMARARRPSTTATRPDGRALRTRSTAAPTRGARRTERSSHSTAVCARSAQTAKH